MRFEGRSRGEGAGQPQDPQAFHRHFVDLLSQLKDDQIAALGRELLPQLSLPQLQRNFLENLAGAVNMSVDQGDVEGAERLLRLMGTVVEALDHAWGRIEHQYWCGQLEMQRGRPEAAIPYFEAASQGARQSAKRLIALHSVALACLQAGNLKEADRRFRVAIKAAQVQSDDLALTHSYIGLAHVERERGRPSVALDWLEKARESAERAGDPGLVAKIAGEVGLLYAQQQRLDEAEAAYEHFEEGLSQGLLGERGYEQLRGIAALVANQAALAIREGRLDEAREFAEQALSSQSLLPPIDQVDNLSVIGGIAMATGDVEGATRHLLSGFQLAEEVSYTKGRVDTGIGLSMAYTLQGYYEPAQRVCRGAIESLERMRSRVGGEIERLGYVRDKMQVYQLLVQLCLILDDLKAQGDYRQQALAYAERAKSRTFIEAMGPTLVDLGPPAGLPPELHKAERELLKELHEMDAKMRSASKDRDLHEANEALQDELEALWLKIGEVAPEYAAIRRGLPIHFTEIRDLLAP